MILEKLKKLELESIQRGIPIVGSIKGKFLYERVLEIKPKKILELGTANGYSGIILGSKGAKLITIDLDKKILDEARKNFNEFNINAKIIIGDAVEEVKKLVDNRKNLDGFDIIFIDFIKNKYIDVLENCINLIGKNGLIIADNITFPGCQDYKKKILDDKRLKTGIINLADGMSCSKKIS